MSRRRFRVSGVVQGVGFRPFVYGLATRRGLGGFVLNDGDGVVVEVEGEEGALERSPKGCGRRRRRSRASRQLSRSRCRRGASGPSASSRAGRTGGAALIPPDVATCDDCLRELFDPADRRYRYPFVNCTRCGPRFTIVRSAPYDRANTTMAGFRLCADCRREYEDPLDRRFHAEPTCCPACGPRLTMPLEEAVGLLRDGRILAVKGLGGYHLACDAADEDAVARLRARKHREEKPFAVLTAEPASLAERLAGRARAAALAGAAGRARSPARERRGRRSVAPGTPWLGLLLPYSPLHHLLAADFDGPLVLTSGNARDEPIATRTTEARRRLDGIADAFLGHDRPIHRRCEDSIVRAGHPLRRSRGYVPSALPLSDAAPAARRRRGRAEEHVLRRSRTRGVPVAAPRRPRLGSRLPRLPRRPRALPGDARLEPELVVHDLHPEYLATKWAREQDAELVGVQHHHAHAAACLAEHGETGPALALVFDGTGYGTDGTLWGGELLRCDLAGFERLAHLEPVPLPGGEAAIREPWRMAAVHLERAGLEVPWPEWAQVRESLKLDPPLASGIGRLFDAVAAVLGLREQVSYEGQAAIELEQLAGGRPAEPFPWSFGDPTELVTVCYLELRQGRPREEVAARFHETVAAAAAEACAAIGEPRTVVLSGGSFQNLRLLASTRERLEQQGFRVLSHRLVPPNDGGISYGQAAVAARRTASCA